MAMKNITINIKLNIILFLCITDKLISFEISEIVASSGFILLSLYYNNEKKTINLLPFVYNSSSIIYKFYFTR
jgi:hypothetical protein